LLRPFS